MRCDTALTEQGRDADVLVAVFPPPDFGREELLNSNPSKQRFRGDITSDILQG